MKHAIACHRGLQSEALDRLTGRLETASSEKSICWPNCSTAESARDPFPYPGGVTSMEALWMGVPVLTRRGDRFLSHVGEGIAHNAGMADWIAADDDDYVSKAIDRAGDLTSLSELRSALRSRVMASPLFDAERFAGHVEEAL